MNSYRGRGGYGHREDTRGGRGFPRGGRGGGGRGRGGPPPLNRDHPLDVTVRTNCFAIKKLPEREYYLYDIFQPEVKGFARRQELFDKLQTTVAPRIFAPRVLYDGKALVYASHVLTVSTFLVGFSKKPPAEGAPGVYRVTLKPTVSDPIRPSDLHALIKNGQASMNSPQVATALNLLNILIRQDSNQKYPHNARAFFSGADKMSLSGGIELWRGFFQSVRPSREHLVINIDTTMAAVFKGGPLLDLCMDYLRLRNVKDLEFQDREKGSAGLHRLEKFLKKIQVMTKTTKSLRRIYELVPKAGRFEFSKDGKNMTVEEHLTTTYNIRIVHPNIVGVRLTNPNSDRQVVLPLEMCYVKEGQFYKQRLPDACTADAVKFATLRPLNRLNAIKGASSEGSSSPLLHYRNSEFIVQSGMEIDTDPIPIRGQLLSLPKVVFGASKVVPEGGKWNVVNSRLYKASSIQCWGVISFVQSVSVERVVQSVRECGQKLGLNIADPSAVESGSGQAVEQAMNHTMNVLKRKFPNIEKADPRPLLLVILPQNAAEVRHRVKHWADIGTGIITQCLREGKLNRANDQYFNNIVLKLNARMKGSNFIVESPAMSDLLSRGPFIIMGADVAHPGPGSDRPSTTSLVYSYDRHATQYSAITEIQQRRVEIIQDLQQMVYDAVFSFGKMNGSPAQIIFFRDGVSEGEFEMVAKNEVKVVQAAIDSLWLKMNIKDPKPRLTFVIVGKRHHIAFFPENNSPANDGNGNCVAGFASNPEDLSHPKTTDFYLQSHAAIQGTSRSGHYTVIHDEIFNFNVDKIQALAFSLCHVYAKATRSVSIPAPVYYADLACARGAFHYAPGSTGALILDTSSIASGDQPFILEEWKQNFKKVNRGVASNMYFI